MGTSCGARFSLVPEDTTTNDDRPAYTVVPAKSPYLAVVRKIRCIGLFLDTV